MKKTVNRMCFICRTVQEKNNLNRLVKNSNGEIFLDKTGKANGRGAYICNSADCLNKLKKQKVLNRAFKCEVPLCICEKICGELIDKNK